MNQWRLRCKVLSIETKQTETNVFGKAHCEWNAYKDVFTQGTFTCSGAMVYVLREKINQEVELHGEFRANQGREGGWFLNADIKSCWPLEEKKKTNPEPATEQPPLGEPPSESAEDVPF